MQVSDVKGLDKQQLKFLERAHERETVKQLTMQLIENPLVEFAVGMAYIAWLTRGKQSWFEKATGIDVREGGLGAGLVAAITAQQLSKSLPYITSTVKELLPAGGIGGLLK